MKGRIFLALVLCIQALCAGFFVADITVSVFGIEVTPLDWALVELIEIGAALGLVLGLVVGWIAIRQARARTRAAEDALRLASGAFMEVLEERFAEWALTPAERDVALFAIKGLSTQEIATLRNASEGTVKAQTAAIYRKAGVSGRPQLLSLFIDELMEVAP
ncbi:MAG: helix-turn-helix transcriptional regulator [Paracoccaceae bacterium]|nr:helix-turn-helix transcriptional regulator [Paracoccaceae bacterium]